MPNKNDLAALVLDQIAVNPCERDGYLWAGKSLGWYASQLKTSLKTVGQLSRSSEFDRLDILISGKKTPLLRLKKPGDLMTPTHCQRLLQKIFVEALPPFNEKKAMFHEESLALLESNLALLEKEKALCEKLDPGNKKAPKAKLAEIALTQKEIKWQSKKLLKAKEDAKKSFKLTPKEYGCLKGLVDAWGVQDAPDLFKMVVYNWSSFMAATKVVIAELEETGPLYYRFYEYPTVTYILLFNHVALEMEIMAIQETGAPKLNDKDYPRYKRIVEARDKQRAIFKKKLGITKKLFSDFLYPHFIEEYYSQ